MKDAEMLERYIQAYEKLNPPYDDEVLQKARRTLAALDAKEGNIQYLWILMGGLSELKFFCFNTYVKEIYLEVMVLH